VLDPGDAGREFIAANRTGLFRVRGLAELFGSGEVVTGPPDAASIDVVVPGISHGMQRAGEQLCGIHHQRGIARYVAASG